jgi:alpha-1,3-glucosyltransferase
MLLQLLQSVYVAAVVLHIAELLVTPPARYPDLFPVLNVLVSAPVFGLAWLWSIKRCVEIKWSLGGLGTSTSTSKSAAGTHESMSTPSSPTLKSVLEKNMNHGTNGTAAGSVRKGGLRTMSLGYAQGRGFRPQMRATSMSSRPASVGPDSMHPPPSA